VLSVSPVRTGSNSIVVFLSFFVIGGRAIRPSHFLTCFQAVQEIAFAKIEVLISDPARIHELMQLSQGAQDLFFLFLQVFLCRIVNFLAHRSQALDWRQENVVQEKHVCPSFRGCGCCPPSQPAGGALGQS
jgi:hypothetical protein